jgi:exosortase
LGDSSLGKTSLEDVAPGEATPRESLSKEPSITGTSSVTFRRLCLYGLWLALSIAIFWGPCTALIRYSLSNDNASHIVLIPLISAWLLYFEQKRIFAKISHDYTSAGILVAFSMGAVFWVMSAGAGWSAAGALGVYILALVCAWIAGFAFFFGRGALKNAGFPLFFLVLMVPLPDSLLNYVIYGLQKGSADIAEMIFDLAGVPALRDGFVFHLAHLSIEVAKECSGIRSSLALLILALLVGHLFLRTLWKQALFVVVGLVIMIVKNGIRIATLTILAQYVDSSFLFGRLHHEGGVVFFAIGLLLLFPVFWLLQRSEKVAAERAGTPTT